MGPALNMPCLGTSNPKHGLFGVSQTVKISARRAHGTCRSSRKFSVGFCPRKPAGRRHGWSSATRSVVTRITPTCLNIVFVSAEVAPWSKTGGLGDVVGGLPIELAKRGHRVMSIAPRYDQYEDAWDTNVVHNINGEEVRYFHTKKEGVERVWVDHPFFLAKVWGKTGAKLYGKKSGADYIDNPKRFMLFCRAALAALEVLPMSFGSASVVVANDWHSAMVPVLVKEVYQKEGKFLDTRVALCIHNIAFQGRFKSEIWPVLQLPDRLKPLFDFEDGIPRSFTEDEPELEEKYERPVTTKLYKKLNWLKAAILTADKVVTVSPHYALEITSGEELGVELDECLRASGPVVGIVNGMDIGDWSPLVDKYITQRYGKDTVAEGKQKNKEAVQAVLGLPKDASIPLFVFVGRLEEQKGIDILVEALPLLKDEKLQVAILGTGSPALERKVKGLQGLYPGKLSVTVNFDTPLAHKLFAGGDFVVVPSRFEPCGLIQMQAMQYGTVPLVASTGGLVDTVEEGVTGFHMGVFDTDRLLPEDAESLAFSVKRAVEVYGTPKFESMRTKCIQQDLSWAKPARVWEHSLDKMFNLPPRPVAALDAAGQPLPVADKQEATLAGISPPSRSAVGTSSAKKPTTGSTPAATPSVPAGVKAVQAKAATPSVPATSTSSTSREPPPVAAPAAPAQKVEVPSPPSQPVRETAAGVNGSLPAAPVPPSADGVGRSPVPPPPPPVVKPIAARNGVAKEAAEKFETELAAAETPVKRLKQEAEGKESEPPEGPSPASKSSAA